MCRFYFLFVFILVFTSCSQKEQTFISDPDYTKNHEWQLTDSLSLSGQYAVKLDQQNPFSLNTPISGVKKGEIYEASVFRLGGDPLLKLAVSGEHDFYSEANRKIKSIGDWQQIRLRIRIPDELDGTTIQFFAYNIGSNINLADSLTVTKLQFNETESLPDDIFLSLTYQILQDFHIRHFKPLAVQDILDYAKREYLEPLFLYKGTNYQQFKNTFEQHIENYDTGKLYAQLKAYREDVHHPSVRFLHDKEAMDKRQIAGYTPGMFFSINDRIEVFTERLNDKSYEVHVKQLIGDYILKDINHFTFEKDTFSVAADQFGEGFYVFVLKQNEHSFKVPIVINGYTDENTVAILAPLSTWHAYNAYGGKSLYRNAIDLNDVNFVSVNRPITSIGFDSSVLSHDFFALYHIFKWFDEHYNASVYPDFFLEASPGKLAGYSTIVIAQHDEYFSPAMFSNLVNLTDAANLISLGGNQLYWKIKWHDDFQTMETRKCGDFFENTDEPGGLWRNILTSEARVLGVAFTESGYGTYAPYQVKNKSHRLLQGLNIPEDGIFGEKGMNGRAISGVETDKMIAGFHENAEKIAKGQNPDNGGAEMVFIPRDKVATFSCGSIVCGTGLGVDSVFSGIISNFMELYHVEK